MSERSHPHPRILAVDDESLIRMSLRIALAREGYLVDTASCGVEAMALLDRHRYDLVLLDLRLPDVSGIEVLRYARRHDPEVKVLLVTASTNAPTALEAAQEGAAGVVSKPFTLQAIAAETRRVIAGPSRTGG
jgi:DNA-binding NtrC family response regulator